MELKVWADGVERSVSGVNEQTTCEQLIYALAHATGQKGKFVLVERFGRTERSLSPADHPLLTLRGWAERAAEVTLTLRRVDGAAIVDDTASSSEDDSSLSTLDSSKASRMQPRLPPLPSMHRDTSITSIASALPYCSMSKSSDFSSHERSTASLPAYSMSSLPRRPRPPPPDYSVVMEQRKLAGDGGGAPIPPPPPIRPPTVLAHTNNGAASASLNPEQDLLSVVQRQSAILDEQRARLKQSEARATDDGRELMQLDAQQRNLRSVLESIRKSDWGRAYEEETRRNRQVRARLLATHEKLKVVKESRLSLAADETRLWAEVQMRAAEAAAAEEAAADGSDSLLPPLTFPPFLDPEHITRIHTAI